MICLFVEFPTFLFHCVTLLLKCWTLWCLDASFLVSWLIVDLSGVQFIPGTCWLRVYPWKILVTYSVNAELPVILFNCGTFILMSCLTVELSGFIFIVKFSKSCLNCLVSCLILVFFYLMPCLNLDFFSSVWFNDDGLFWFPFFVGLFNCWTVWFPVNSV